MKSSMLPAGAAILLLLAARYAGATSLGGYDLLDEPEPRDSHDVPLWLGENSRARPAIQTIYAPASAVPDPRDFIVEGLVGAWDNGAQFDAAPTALKVPPSVEGDWLDLQHALFAVVDAPLIGDRVLYLEWRSGGPEGPISRQRIWSFINEPGGEIRMDFFAFVDGASWAGRAADPGAFTTLTTAALRGYGPACALRFVPAPGGFLGQITADECTLTAASGRSMGIDARVSLDADGVLEYSESGRLADGRYAFRVPPTQPYRFVRRP